MAVEPRQALEARGLRAWLDRDEIRPGNQFVADIEGRWKRASRTCSSSRRTPSGRNGRLKGTSRGAFGMTASHAESSHG